jgi:hypothetical protein
VNTKSRDAAHQEFSALIPWYVNGTLHQEDRDKFDRHLAVCAQCRADLAVERQIHGSIAQQAAVEYMPAGSLKKLLNRIDGIEQRRGAGPAQSTRARPRLPRQPRWHGMLAASVAVLAIAVSVLAFDRLMPRHGGATPAFYTVTQNARHSPDEVIRAVFAPNITLTDLQALLDEAQLRIISGPTEAGVYSLAATSSRPVNTSLALLRQHASVRFAEGTQVTAGPDRSP